MRKGKRWRQCEREKVCKEKGDDRREGVHTEKEDSDGVHVEEEGGGGGVIRGEG